MLVAARIIIAKYWKNIPKLRGWNRKLGLQTPGCEISGNQGMQLGGKWGLGRAETSVGYSYIHSNLPFSVAEPTSVVQTLIVIPSDPQHYLVSLLIGKQRKDFSQIR